MQFSGCEKKRNIHAGCSCKDAPFYCLAMTNNILVMLFLINSHAGKVSELALKSKTTEEQRE